MVKNRIIKEQFTNYIMSIETLKKLIDLEIIPKNDYEKYERIIAKKYNLSNKSILRFYKLDK